MNSLSFANGSCVEVAELPDGEVAVRNSRDPDGAVLRFAKFEWLAFISNQQAERSGQDNNRYSFMKWVLDDLWRALRFVLVVGVLIVAAVMAPHLLGLFG